MSTRILSILVISLAFNGTQAQNLERCATYLSGWAAHAELAAQERIYFPDSATSFFREVGSDQLLQLGPGAIQIFTPGGNLTFNEEGRCLSQAQPNLKSKFKSLMQQARYSYAKKIDQVPGRWMVRNARASNARLNLEAENPEEEKALAELSHPRGSGTLLPPHYKSDVEANFTPCAQMTEYQETFGYKATYKSSSAGVLELDYVTPPLAFTNSEDIQKTLRVGEPEGLIKVKRIPSNSEKCLNGLSELAAKKTNSSPVQYFVAGKNIIVNDPKSGLKLVTSYGVQNIKNLSCERVQENTTLSSIAQFLKNQIDTLQPALSMARIPSGRQRSITEPGTTEIFKSCSEVEELAEIFKTNQRQSPRPDNNNGGGTR